MSKPRTFQELASKAHDTEMTIANYHGKSPSSYEFKKDKSETKKIFTPSKALTKVTMKTSTRGPVKGVSREEVPLSWFILVRKGR